MQWPFVYVDQPWRLDQLQKMVSRCHHGGRHLKREKQSILELPCGPTDYDTASADVSACSSLSYSPSLQTFTGSGKY